MAGKYVYEFAFIIKPISISMKKIKIEVLIFLIITLSFSPLFLIADGEEGLGWPQKIEGEKGSVIIYQPQIESFTGDKLEARAAVSVTTIEHTTPVFGAMWFECRVSTDRDERTVTLLDIKVSIAKFPEAKEENVDKVIAFVEAEIPKLEFILSLDGLLASLETDESGAMKQENYDNSPPEIIFKTTPSVLIMIDGDPVLKDTDKSGYQYVVNTPFFIVKDTKNEVYYIKGGNYWYSSPDPKSGWGNISNPPKSVEQLAEELITDQEEESDSTNTEASEDEVIPQLFVRVKPAELLQSGGEPEFEPIQETSLLYMKNTDDDILMNIETQEYFVLIAGRWYKSKSLTEGDWTYVNPNEVPEDFAKIPSGSEMAVVKSSVAGTQEAKEAVLENQIPQTAEVSRTDASVEVTYDGDPKFEKIDGTNMKYAVNTDKSVLLIDGRYYCCDNAIWFESGKPEGPWTVSVVVPDDVQEIPPESPVYNVKYVYIYDYSPTVVYVGYTPGYVHSYVYMGTVYYGTGYYYQPWYGAYYYPRPVTYGFGVHYNPYSGWGFSMTVSRGWFSVGFHSSPYGYWGPAGYRHGYHHGYRHGYNRGAAAGYRAGYNAGQRNTASNNVYRNRSDGVSRTGGDRYNPKTGDRVNKGTQPSTRQKQDRANQKNNVYADKNGNVYKKDNDGWKSRENGQWKDTSTGSREATRNESQTKPADRSSQVSRDQGNRQGQPQTRESKPTSQTRQSNQTVDRSAQNRNMDNLNHDANSRNRGAQRSSNYNQNRQSNQYQRSGSSQSGASRSGGATRSGGGRRR